MYTDDDLYNSTLWKNSEVMRNFVNLLSVASDKELNKEDPESQRPTKGRSIQEITGTDEEIVIYRACKADCEVIKPMDCVTRSKKWAEGHAEHMVVTEEENWHVLYAWVHPKDVYEAPNLGEFFYDGPEVKARRLKLITSAAKLERERRLMAEKAMFEKKAELVSKLKNLALDADDSTASYLIERAVLDIESF